MSEHDIEAPGQKKKFVGVSFSKTNITAKFFGVQNVDIFPLPMT